MKVNPLVFLTIEEVVAFRATRVQAGVIWRRERTISSLAAVENKGTRILPLLPTCRYTEVWNSQAVFTVSETWTNRYSCEWLSFSYFDDLSLPQLFLRWTLRHYYRVCRKGREKKRRREEKIDSIYGTSTVRRRARISHCFFVIPIYYPRTLHYYRAVYNPLSGLINIDMY